MGVLEVRVSNYPLLLVSISRNDASFLHVCGASGAACVYLVEEVFTIFIRTISISFDAFGKNFEGNSASVDEGLSVGWRDVNLSHELAKLKRASLNLLNQITAFSLNRAPRTNFLVEDAFIHIDNLFQDVVVELSSRLWHLCGTTALPRHMLLFLF